MAMMFKVLHDWKHRTSLDIGAVGVKIRLGLSQMEQDHKVYLRLVDAANAQLDYLTVHARHAKQRSSDIPSWNAIKEIKDIATIPIIGNGNVVDMSSAQRMFSQTGCDGIMIARAAINNPWIFRELTGRGTGSPTKEELSQAGILYEEFAKYGTKEKYAQFHHENFQRMSTGNNYVMSKNTNLQ
jgi:tRNA-dihydrouridine synthase